MSMFLVTMLHLLATKSLMWHLITLYLLSSLTADKNGDLDNGTLREFFRSEMFMSPISTPLATLSHVDDWLDCGSKLKEKQSWNAQLAVNHLCKSCDDTTDLFKIGLKISTKLFYKKNNSTFLLSEAELDCRHWKHTRHFLPLLKISSAASY